MAGALPSNTIIVKKKKKNKGHGSHGAWKVAFADFAIAMMAFFLVLWLQEATSIEEKQAISKYFNDPVGFEEGGSRYVIDFGGKAPSTENSMIDSQVSLKATEDEVQKVIDAEMIQELAKRAEKEKFQDLANELKNKIEKNEALKPYKDQVIMNVTDEGLQVQIVDKEFRPMFASGSNRIKVHTKVILEELAKTLASVPNKIVISGHTDATAFTGRRGYSNWELSSERANSARRTLQSSGIKDEKIAQVVGHGSSKLFDENAPNSPVNRRVSILVLSQDSQRELEGGTGDSAEETPPQQPKPDIENPANVSDGKEAASAVQNFRRQQVLRSQQEDINDQNRNIINQPVESSAPEAASGDDGDFFEFGGDDGGFGGDDIGSEAPNNNSTTPAIETNNNAFELTQPEAQESVAPQAAPAPSRSLPANQSSNGAKSSSSPSSSPAPSQPAPAPKPKPKPVEKPWWED